MARTRTKAPLGGRTKSNAPVFNAPASDAPASNSTVSNSTANQPPSQAHSFREANDVLTDGGVTPLDVMIGTMRALWREAHSGTVQGGEPLASPPDAGERRDERPDMRLRDKALAIAEKVAPYIHPRARPPEPQAGACARQAFAIEIVFVKPDGPEPPS